MSAAEQSARRSLEKRLAQGSRGFIPFLTAGFPDWSRFTEAIEALCRSGADVLEIGVPFSDPLADGPTIQASSQQALQQGVTLEQILLRLARSAGSRQVPVILMTYANPVLAYGAERFARDVRAAGVSGVLVSDLPPEELPELWQALSAEELERVLLVAPTTAERRIPLLTRAATGYVYCVTRTGVTGQGGGFSANLREQAARVRAHTDLPVVAGFGIRSPEDARVIADIFDGVVLGARLVEILRDESREGGLRGLERFARGVRKALDSTGESGAFDSSGGSAQ